MLFNKNQIVENSFYEIGKGGLGKVYKIQVNQEIMAEKVITVLIEKIEDLGTSIKSVINELNML